MQCAYSLLFEVCIQWAVYRVLNTLLLANTLLQCEAYSSNCAVQCIVYAVYAVSNVHCSIRLYDLVDVKLAMPNALQPPLVRKPLHECQHSFHLQVQMQAKE